MATKELGPGTVKLTIGVESISIKAESITLEPVKAGWGWPSNSRKAHYFIGGRSLCGRWLYLGKHLEQDKHSSPDNCVACKNKRSKL